MKKFIPGLLILSFFVLLSCGDDEDSCGLNPPNWLVGKWQEPNSGTLGYEITNSNVIQESPVGAIDICQRHKSENEQEGTSAEIEILERSSNLFSFTLNSSLEIGFSQKLEYTFERVDEDRVRICQDIAPCTSVALVYVRQ